MSLPATLKVLGIVPAFVLILVIAFLAEVSVEFLMRFTRSGETTTYAGVMREAFGPFGAAAVQLCVVFTNLGCLIMYLIIAADVLSGNKQGREVHLGCLQQWFGIHWWTSRQFALLLTLIFILLPLVLFRRVESLKFSSAISTLLAVAFVSTCSVLAIDALVEGRTQNLRFFFLVLITILPSLIYSLLFQSLSQPTHFISMVILVGHSTGGLSVTQACHKFAKKIRLAVYVAATMLKLGFWTHQDVKDLEKDIEEKL